MSGITYTKFPNYVWESKELTVQEKSTLFTLFLRLHNGKMTCFPKLETIGACIQRSPRSVSRYLKSLAEKGFIKIQNRGHKSNLYTILCGIIWDDNTDSMVELNESNCAENKDPEIEQSAIKTMEKVNSVVERNTSPATTNKSYPKYKKKNTSDWNPTTKPKDEYAYDMSKIKQQLRDNARQAYEEIKDNGKRTLTTGNC
ncbi:helix-turn-helix domain-containing protein [Clostridium cylindrosporum]|uniref:Helix-turn-helix domain-containing protein n=1 Tax=Clostridium cylindrosporum DSM 605 TaxID=1121307 RepID=A0A0J8DB62_CLOCY|nr:helix-turn-helix domain-containing protein [Clostridium cylindrosporum]KMT21518.1 hypothetical protein CLCY_2c02790 [Clostridium cylindrosporum DSM 605]